MNPHDRTRCAGWFRAEGEEWQRVAVGTPSECWRAVLDVAEFGELLLLPVGEVPTAERRGQLTRGLTPEFSGWLDEGRAEADTDV